MNDMLNELAHAAAEARRQVELRNRLAARARRDGATWRTIAAAADMTETGIRKAVHTAGLATFGVRSPSPGPSPRRDGDCSAP